MQMDFHYYATYAAAVLAGYSHEEALDIAYSAQFVDECTTTLLGKLEAPRIAATTQMSMELVDAKTDIMGLQDITRIWSSFHFLPRDLYAPKKKGCGKLYMNKYRLICGPNGELVKDTVDNAKRASEPNQFNYQAIGIAMHVVADTWAHMHFAGTPSLAINNTNDYFYEMFDDGTSRKISFKHNPITPDDLEKGAYSASMYQSFESNIMNLGHGRAGHLPDYSFIVYKYLPAWNGYNEVIKDNPSDYNKAFRQLIYAMKCIREGKQFETGVYDEAAVQGYEDEINAIIKKRQHMACDEWKSFGEKLSGQSIPDYDVKTYQEEYVRAKDKEVTFLGKFFLAAIKHKSMVTNRIYESGNMLAGYSVTPDNRELAKEMVQNLFKAG